MELYNICCPLCGTLNHSLYLEETGGWMECIRCGQTVLYIKTAAGASLIIKNPLHGKNGRIYHVIPPDSGNTWRQFCNE